VNNGPRKEHANTRHMLDPQYRYNSVTDISDVISILSFRRVLYVVCFLLGISPASEV